MTVAVASRLDKAKGKLFEMAFVGAEGYTYVRLERAHSVGEAKQWARDYAASEELTVRYVLRFNASLHLAARHDWGCRIPND